MLALFGNSDIREHRTIYTRHGNIMSKAYKILICSFILATSVPARAQILVNHKSDLQNDFTDLNAIISEISRVKSLCPRGTEAFRRPIGKFIITGRGSLPPSPLEPLSGNNIISNLATLDTSKTPNVSIRQAPLTYPTPTIEAQGFTKTSDGDIELVTVAPNTTPSNINVVALPCPKN